MRSVNLVCLSLTVTYVWSYPTPFAKDAVNYSPTQPPVPVLKNARGEFNLSEGIGLLSVILKKYQDGGKNSERRQDGSNYDKREYGEVQNRAASINERNNGKVESLNGKLVDERHSTGNSRERIVENGNNGYGYRTRKPVRTPIVPLEKNKSARFKEEPAGTYKGGLGRIHEDYTRQWKDGSGLLEWNGFDGRTGKLFHNGFENYGRWNGFSGRGMGGNGQPWNAIPKKTWNGVGGGYYGNEWNGINEGTYGNVWNGIYGGALPGKRWSGPGDYGDRWNGFNGGAPGRNWGQDAWNGPKGLGHTWNGFIGSEPGKKGDGSFWNRFGKDWNYGGWNRLGKDENYGGWNRFIC